ncbi:hypothetical protein [uncultured Rhodoblastus sp.]|uniref:hypothetical protein n=1 Tax=uncultured Rhodoblastus sp. TaxID=543037 RepID=UPI0025CC1D2F|nr:hypothetical protein [uncultured Rhodoblastus sp.]
MAPSEIVIHARYEADGSVNEISELPEGVSGQKWFNLLCVKVPHAAQALAGGRMIFRINATELESLKAAAAA